MRVMGDRAQHNVECHHTWDQITRDNLELYDSLLGSNVRHSVALTAR